MGYGTFGIDPVMAADADQIFSNVISLLYNQGQITLQQRDVCAQQYSNYRGAIFSDIHSKAQAQGRSADREVIQASIHDFITNFLQSSAMQARAGMGGYGGLMTPSYGGGMPGMGYGGSPMITSGGGFGGYSGYGQQPYFSQPQPSPSPLSYNQYGGGRYGGGQPAGLYPFQQVSETAIAAANRYSKPAENKPEDTQTIGSGFQRQTQQTKIEYNAAQVLETVEVKSKDFKGTKKVLRLGPNEFMDFIYGNMYTPVMNFRDFLKRMSVHSTYSEQFIASGVQIPKIIKAKTTEVMAIIQRISEVLNRAIAENGNGLLMTSKIFSKFYVEFQKESGQAFKELTDLLVDEFNSVAASGYIFFGNTGKCRIENLDDINELFNPNTTNSSIKKWQEHENYFSHLSSIVNQAIFSLFQGSNGYRVLDAGTRSDCRIISSVFRDLEADGVSVGDGFYEMNHTIEAQKVDSNTFEKMSDLRKAIENNTVVLVPRVYVYSNHAPAGFAIGDYANLTIARDVSSITNVFEECLNVAMHQVNNHNLAIAIRGAICSGSSMIGMSIGTNLSRHIYIGPMIEPVISL